MADTGFDLRPAGGRETKQFYAMTPEDDAALGCIGHVRIYFGPGGNEFCHTWHLRGSETLNTPAFRTDLSSVVDELRKSVLSGLSGMRVFCGQNGGYMDGGWAPNYGYVIETDSYRYCLRCIPMPGDYNAYLTCFDKHVQQMNLGQQDVHTDAALLEVENSETEGLCGHAL